jgi:hypothetical protein
VDGLSVSGPKNHVTHGVGGTSRSVSDCSWMGKLSSNGPLRHKGETSRVTLVSTAVVRMGEGVCVDGGEWTRLTGYHAIDGRTAAGSATDGSWVK